MLDEENTSQAASACEVFSSIGRNDGHGAGGSSVVVSGLENVDPIRPHPVHQAILLGDPPAPHIGAEVAERLRLPFAVMRRAACRLDQLRYLPRDPGILVYPIPEVIQRLRLNLKPSLPFRFLLRRAPLFLPGHALPVEPDRGRECLDGFELLASLLPGTGERRHQPRCIPG